MGLARARGTLVVALALCAAVAPSAYGAEANFPGPTPPATEITRDFTLKQAAQLGLVQLTGKGGGGEGDLVSLTLTHKQVRGAVNVTVHVEFTVPERLTLPERDQIVSVLPEFKLRAESELNRGYKTPQGDPINFNLDFKFRASDAAPRPNYHQVLLVNPLKDLDEPNPKFRAHLSSLPVPNRSGSISSGEFDGDTFIKSNVLAHEMLHLVGLDDRYWDYYRVRGKDYPLPDRALPPSELAAFARRNRLPAPPAGRVINKDRPGTSGCDFMGRGELRNCRRIAKRDLKWIDSRAAVRVVAEPGDLLLNKDAAKQNFGVAFRSRVTALPGGTTTAEGVSVVCIDKSRLFPLDEGFDVLGPARELPGYGPLAALLDLSGRIQPSLDETAPGMLAAVWNVTDAAPLAFSGTAEQSQALLGQAGIAPDSVPDAPTLPNPNTGSADTAAVSPTGVEPTQPSEESKAVPPVTINAAQLFPSRVAAGRRARSILSVSAIGDVKSATLVLQRRKGGRWRKVRSLGSRRLSAGTEVIPLRLGRVSRGRHRMVVSVAGPIGRPVTRRVKLTVS